MRLRSPLILVIDDDLETLNLLKIALQRRGFSVLTAANSHEVADRVEMTYKDDRPIDVIVLDIMMPGESGFDIFRSLRAVLVPMPPVIMLTAVTGMQQRLDAHELGAFKYLTKPTTPKILIGAIDEALEVVSQGKTGKLIGRFPPKSFSGTSN